MDVKSGYKQNEVGVIPVDWESATVREIASPVRNAIVGGPFGSDLVSKDYVEDGVPVLRGQNMGSRFVSGNFAFVTRTKASSLEANLARPEDLVFTQRGTLGQVSLVPAQPYDRYLVSQSQMKLTVSRKIANPLFFYYVFSSAEQQEFIRQNTIQTGVPHINLGILRAIPVQRPSLAEQEAIAEALSDADALIESLEQLVAKKRQIKQGAMQELLTGKRRLPGFEIKPGYKQAEAGVIPKDWAVVPLSRLLELRNGVNADKNAYGTGISFINVLEIITKSHLRASDIPGQVSLSKSSRDTYSVRRGDLVFNRTSETQDEIGLASVFLDDEPVVFGGFVIRGRPIYGAALHAEYAGYAFRAPALRRQIVARGQGAIRANIGQADLRAMIVPLPALLEQRAIAEMLADIDMEITALQAKLAKARQIKQGMMQELLTGRIRLV
jgi:type I restriction enzyme, S subunit